MPVDRTLAEGLAQTLVDIYGRTAERLTAAVAARLEEDLAGVDRPDRLERRLLAAEALNTQARRLVDRLDTEMAEGVQQMVVLAAERGSAEALRELGRLGFQLPSTLAEVREQLPGAEAVQRLAYSLTSTLRGTHLRITRWPADVYREITSRESADILLGTRTRRQAAQQMWSGFVERGVTGFVDRSGRAWRLESYVDMASRTIAAQAAVEAHLDRLAEAGLDLVIVSDAPQECKLCRPWEGKVLSRDAAALGQAPPSRPASIPAPDPQPRPTLGTTSLPIPRQPAPRIDPRVAAAQEHARRQLVASGEPRAALLPELDRQAQLAPGAMARLRTINVGGQFDTNLYSNANAYYDFDEIHLHPDWRTAYASRSATLQRGIDTGWTTPTGAENPIASTLAHEYGHHLVEQLRRGDVANLQRFAATIGDQLDLPIDRSTVSSLRDLDAQVRAAIQTHSQRISTMVSQVGAMNTEELLAEIWQEYSTLGAAARPHIRAIGELMRDLAEGAA